MVPWSITNFVGLGALAVRCSGKLVEGEVPGERSLFPHSSQEPEKWRYTIDESGIAVPVLRSAFGGKPTPTPSYTASSPFSLKVSDATPLGAGPPPWFDPFQDEDARLAFFASLAAEGCLTHFKTYSDVSPDNFRVDTSSLLPRAPHDENCWVAEGSEWATWFDEGCQACKQQTACYSFNKCIRNSYCEMDRYVLKRLVLVVSGTAGPHKRVAAVGARCTSRRFKSAACAQGQAPVSWPSVP